MAKRIAAVDRILAEKDADMVAVAASSEKLRTAVAAEAERLMIEAENTLTEDARAASMRSKMLERLEGIIRESVKPLENIEGIKIVQMSGVNDAAGGQTVGQPSPTDEVINSALRYRAQAPLIDDRMKEIGVDSNVSKMGDVFRAAKAATDIANRTKKKDDE